MDDKKRNEPAEALTGELDDEALDAVDGGVFAWNETHGHGGFGSSTPYTYMRNLNASRAISWEKSIKRLIDEGDLAGAGEKAQGLYSWLKKNGFKNEAARFQAAYWKYLPD